jgi:hypothetical protein
MNNGYNIDTAPNGEPSILFQSLLENLGGEHNRKLAIKYKALVYSNTFIKWFGDWTQPDKSNVSKVVDKNGEPLLVYRGEKTGDMLNYFHEEKKDGFNFFSTDLDYAARYGITE